jgi:hypothetical protein
MDLSEEAERRRKWITRIVAVILGGAFLVWAGMNVAANAFLLFPIAGVVIGLVWALDVPQWLFSGIDAARHKVAGVEHAGRHEWYAFKGHRVRVFLSDTSAPWFPVKEIAHLLDLKEPERVLRHFGVSEAATPPFSGGERCLSEAGLRRLLAHTQHPDTGPLKLWLEREVLFPLSRRKDG